MVFFANKLLGLLQFASAVVNARVHPLLLGLVFSLTLATYAYGQECNSSFGAESMPINENLYAETLSPLYARNNNAVHNTALDRFFCKAAPRTYLDEQFLTTSSQLLLRMEYSSWQNDAWEPRGSTNYGYDENGFSVNVVFQNWNGDSWLNTSQAVFENDDQGRMLTFISQLWDGGFWQNNSRRVNTWNGMDELVETVHEDWIEGGWRAHRRDLMSYENSLLVEEVLESLVGTNWKSDFRYSQEYDEQGRQVRYLSEYYNSSSMEWIASGQETIVYGDDYIELHFHSWDSEAQDWFAYSRTVVELNEQGDPVVVINEGRSPNEEWTLVSRVMHTYNDIGLETELLVQRFEESDWQNKGLYTRAYDDQGNIISTIWSSWESEQNRWMRSSLRTYSYGQATNIEDDGAYSPLSIDLYPVPARDHVRIEIALTQPTPLIVDVYDLLGRQVARLSDTPQAMGTLRIDWQPADVAPGVYLARIHTGERVETKRLVLVK